MSDRTSRKQTLILKSLNVCGIKSTISDPDFIEAVISDASVLCLQETHLGSSDNVSIPGFVGFFSGQDRIGSRGRHPGGVAIFVRNDLFSISKRITHNCTNCIWVEISLESSSPLLIGCVYNQPVGSSYRKLELF